MANENLQISFHEKYFFKLYSLVSITVFHFAETQFWKLLKDLYSFHFRAILWKENQEPWPYI